MDSLLTVHGQLDFSNVFEYLEDVVNLVDQILIIIALHVSFKAVEDQ